VEYASRLIKASGFRLILQMMTGLPGDSPERSIRTAEKIIALRPDGVRIYPTVIVRDTMLYDLWQSGQYTEHTVEDAVSLCARLLPMFEKASIPVIRLGLNPTEELSAGSAAAGAYHPALGELVKSRMLRSEAEKRLASIMPGSRVCLFVHPKKLSQMAGQHKCNITYLQEKFALSCLAVCPDPALSEQEIRIKTDRQ
jgi:histone acetyltransferase (RNA polymerase elongator complex component)